MTSKHDRTAGRLAQKEGVEYNRGQGPDVNSARRAIEVETADTASDGLRQLRGFSKPVYIAGADAEATEAALKATKGTTVGVMNSQGQFSSARLASARRPLLAAPPRVAFKVEDGSRT